MTGQVEMPPAACICCAETSAAPAKGLPGLLRCGGCGHVWADLALSDDELAALYARDYFEGDEYLDYEMEAPALARNFRFRLRDLTRAVPSRGRLWEIGAAYGFFLQAARDEGFEASGCDISEHAAGIARDRFGLDVAAADYLSMPAPQIRHDAVCLWDTVEHLRDPHLYLAKAHAELREGGAIALSTGDIGSLNARLSGSRWRLIHPPTHLHYFTASSMATLLRRIGFRDVRVSHPAFWRSADAVAYRLMACPPGSKPIRAAVYAKLKAWGLLGFFFPLNTGDLMSVTAIK